MLKFNIIQTLKPNQTILDIIKDYSYKTKNGRIKTLKNTNLQFVEPIEYLISSPKKLTIYEYKINKISNKHFYVKEHNDKYTLQEICKILRKIKF